MDILRTPDVGNLLKYAEACWEHKGSRGRIVKIDVRSEFGLIEKLNPSPELIHVRFRTSVESNFAQDAVGKVVRLGDYVTFKERYEQDTCWADDVYVLSKSTLAMTTERTSKCQDYKLATICRYNRYTGAGQLYVDGVYEPVPFLVGNLQCWGNPANGDQQLTTYSLEVGDRVHCKLYSRSKNVNAYKPLSSDNWCQSSLEILRSAFVESMSMTKKEWRDLLSMAGVPSGKSHQASDGGTSEPEVYAYDLSLVSKACSSKAIPGQLCHVDAVFAHRFSESFKYQEDVLPTMCPLPNDVVRQIFGYLAPKELTACTLVCRDWYQMGRDDLFWKKLCSDRAWQDLNFNAEKCFYALKNMGKEDAAAQALCEKMALSTFPVPGWVMRSAVQTHQISWLLVYEMLFRTPRPCERYTMAPLALLWNFQLHAISMAIAPLTIAKFYALHSPASLGRNGTDLDDNICRWLQQQSQGSVRPHAVCKAKLRSILRHYAPFTCLGLRKLGKEPHLAKNLKSKLQNEDDVYWLFDFADSCPECPAYVRSLLLDYKRGWSYRHSWGVQTWKTS